MYEFIIINGKILQKKDVENQILRDRYRQSTAANRGASPPQAAAVDPPKEAEGYTILKLATLFARHERTIKKWKSDDAIEPIPRKGPRKAPVYRLSDFLKKHELPPGKLPQNTIPAP